MASCRCCCAALAALLAILVGHSLYVWPDVSARRVGVVGEPPDLRSSCPAREAGFRPEDLQRRGLSVFPNFLEASDVEAALKLYNSKKDQSTFVKGQMGGIRTIEDYELVPVHPRMTDLMFAVQNATDLRLGSKIVTPGECSADGVRLIGQFFHTNNIDPRTSAKLVWHQDVELGIDFPDAYDYLAVYIFLEKSHPGDGGLSVVPFDLLKGRSPELHDITKGTASRAFREHRGNQTWIEGFLQDENIVYPSRMEEVECVPELKPGDAIVLRGDLIHATQACKTPGSFRTSMNLRLQPIADVSPFHLLRGKLQKAEWINHLPVMYSYTVTCSLVAYHPWLAPYWQSIAYNVIPAMLHGTLWYKRLLSALRILVAGLRGEG